MKFKNKIFFILSILVFISICFASYYFRDNLYIFYRDYIIHERDNITLVKNNYYRNYDFLYVQNTNNFIATNEQDIKNIIYTVLNSGINNFTFYCDDNYKDCLNYINTIATENSTLSSINNYVNPFNSFKNIDITYSNKGKITLDIKKNYTEEEIILINKKIDDILSSIIKDDFTDEQKITAIHNYIINNGKYASNEENNDSYSKANSILIDGLGTCNSYADAMALFLDKLSIKNYKISSTTHVWNLVYLNEQCLHLDLTWDDPILSDGSDTLEFIFLLITDNRLKELDTEQHNYNSDIYLELKED